MTAAATVGPQWGPPYTYDGFGNLIQSHVTQGSGAEWSNASNPATNQMAGMTYDANGNNVTPGAPCCGTSYDMENRLVSQYLDRNVPTWVYDPSGKRVAQTNGSNFYYWTLYFYDIFGNRIETVNGDGNYPSSGTSVTTNVYFGSKLIQSNGVAVTTDRQGSVRYAANGTRFSYLPYGEEQTTATPDGQIKFGTYFRDSSYQSQDYADQRYYNFWYGRFNTPDPYQGSTALADPTSWNRYAYVTGDPIAYTDPPGLARCSAEGGTSCMDADSGVAYWNTVLPTTATQPPSVVYPNRSAQIGGQSRAVVVLTAGGSSVESIPALGGQTTDLTVQTPQTTSVMTDSPIQSTPTLSGGTDLETAPGNQSFARFSSGAGRFGLDLFSSSVCSALNNARGVFIFAAGIAVISYQYGGALAPPAAIAIGATFSIGLAGFIATHELIRNDCPGQ